MIYTQPLKLIKQISVLDDIGNVRTIETINAVFALEQKVGTQEFYNATAVGIKPTAELVLKACNYHGEELAEYKGERYAVIRTFPKDRYDIVVVLGVKSGY